MILKLDNGNEAWEGTAKWQSSMAWYDAGQIHPITVTVTYVVPNMEVLAVDCEYDKTQLDNSFGLRLEVLMSATALEEFAQSRDKLRKGYLRHKKTARIDPLFE